LGFQTPHIDNGGNKAIASNGGLGGGGMGDQLVEKKSPRIKTLMLKDAPKKEHFT